MIKTSLRYHEDIIDISLDRKSPSMVIVSAANMIILLIKEQVYLQNHSQNHTKPPHSAKTTI